MYYGLFLCIVDIKMVDIQIITSKYKLITFWGNDGLLSRQWSRVGSFCAHNGPTVAQSSPTPDPQNPSHPRTPGPQQDTTFLPCDEGDRHHRWTGKLSVSLHTRSSKAPLYLPDYRSTDGLMSVSRPAGETFPFPCLFVCLFVCPNSFFHMCITVRVWPLLQIQTVAAGFLFVVSHWFKRSNM